MSKIVVAKKVRLGKNGDNFDPKLIAEVERESAKLDDEFIKDFNKSWKTSGRMYIVNEELTKERDNKLQPKPDRAALIAEATAMELEFAKNIKTDALIELIKSNK